MRRSRLLFSFPSRERLCLGIAVFSYRSLPHWGRGTASAVDRVLSFIVDLRRIFSLFFIPLVPYPARFARHLPHAGKGDRAAVDRVLSLMAYLRRSFPLSFIPLVPYPARSARHLPLAGKALSIGIVFPTYPVFALTIREKRHSRFVAFPIGEGGPRQRWIGCSRISST